MIQYFKYGNSKYKKIYSFEPEPHQYAHCKEIIEKVDIRIGTYIIMEYMIIIQNYILVQTAAVPR